MQTYSWMVHGLSLLVPKKKTNALGPIYCFAIFYYLIKINSNVISSSSRLTLHSHFYDVIDNCVLRRLNIQGKLKILFNSMFSCFSNSAWLIYQLCIFIPPAFLRPI